MTHLTLPEAPQVKAETSPKLAERFWSKVDRSGECWPWTAARFDTGYGAVYVRGKILKAHRVAWSLAHGPIPVGAHVLHRCDNPPCVRPEHLFLGSMRDNVADMVAKGRHHRHGRAILDEEKVREIRKLRTEGLTLKSIGERYGVSWVAIHLVVTGKRWGHVR